VYTALARIPRGYVTTYGLLAHAINCKSPRAVGSALRKNPDPVTVPCHRVIRADLTIGGYKGRTGGSAVAEKKRLLAAEGVFFDKNRLRDPERIWVVL